MAPSIKNINILPDSDKVNLALATYCLEISTYAIADKGSFHLALAGGSTPRSFYQYLATSDFAQRIDWQHTHIYFGDERSVPPDHADSNYLMAREALLDKVALPKQNIHRMQGERKNLQQSAKDYSEILRSNIPVSKDNFPEFDLILLGLGPDGHTASLFPDTDILQETNAVAAAVYVEKMQTWRLSLSYPSIENAKHVVMLVTGESKAKIIHDILHHVSKEPPYPTQRLQEKNILNWFLDADAAHLITDLVYDADTGC